MIERGSDKHGPNLDDQMKHESEADLKGRHPGHLGESRQTEPFPDETDDVETRAALDRDLGPERATGETEERGTADETGEAQGQ